MPWPASGFGAGRKWPPPCTYTPPPSHTAPYYLLPPPISRALPPSLHLVCDEFFASQMCGEASVFLEADGQQHYVRGGKPGYYPTLKDKFPHPIPFNLFDPFGFTSKMTPEKKEKSLLAEINNGRLAMLGMMGVLSASKGLIVPGLDSLPIKPYAGEIMAPFTEINADLPVVPWMLSLPKFMI